MTKSVQYMNTHLPRTIRLSIMELSFEIDDLEEQHVHNGWPEYDEKEDVSSGIVSSRMQSIDDAKIDWVYALKMVGKVLDMVSLAVACVEKTLPCAFCLVSREGIHAIYVIFAIVVALQVRSSGLIDEYYYEKREK